MVEAISPEEVAVLSAEAQELYDSLLNEINALLMANWSQFNSQATFYHDTKARLLPEHVITRIFLAFRKKGWTVRYSVNTNRNLEVIESYTHTFTFNICNI